MYCNKCKMESVVKFGHRKNGIQRYRCNNCFRFYKDDEQIAARKAALMNKKLLILTVFILKRRNVSYQSLMRLFGISKSSIYYWCECVRQESRFSRMKEKMQKITGEEIQELAKTKLQAIDKSQIADSDLKKIDYFLAEQANILSGEVERFVVDCR